MSATRVRWLDALEALAQQHGVPGAALAVLADGELTEAATGVLNVETAVAATTDSVFQIGSVTKIYTATLVMELVEQGRLGLDTRVVEVLPELTLADPEAAAEVTVRHLLTHTSGIDGDHFEDTGRGDDVLARYVESCADVGFLHPVGATMSYCNTGFVIAGRIVERLTRGTWDAAVRTRLCEPLGLERTATLPEDLLRFRVAYGYEAGEAGELTPTRSWGLPRSLGPAGLVCATARDLAGFGRAHLDGGLLSAETAARMRAPQVSVPDRWTYGPDWGLGWMLFDWDGVAAFGHDGNTMGQSAFLRVIPEAGVVIALLTNVDHAFDLSRELFDVILGELCGATLPAMPEPPASPPPVDLARHSGRYERRGTTFELRAEDGELVAEALRTGALAELDDEPVVRFSLKPVDQDLFVTRIGNERTWTPAVFFRLADGAPYLHMGARATPKVA